MLSEHLKSLALDRAATSRPTVPIQNRIPDADPHDRGVPDLPDVSLQGFDDPLADNRLFSAELSAEQASSFGVLEWKSTSNDL